MFQLKWVWQNLKGYRGRYIFALFSTVILASSYIVQNLIISQIMDTVFEPLKTSPTVTDDLIHRLIFLVIILVGFTLLRTSFCYLSVMTYETCSQGLVYKLRNDLYRNMQKQDMSFFSKNRTGDLMTRLTGDMDMIRHTVCWVLRMTIDNIILFMTTAICFLVKDRFSPFRF